jgi:peptide/nickel transport system ATP-binding protein
MIFQEPMTSLNPVFTVGDQIGESLRLHAGLDAAKAREQAIGMLRQVGIPAPEQRVDEYPHQLSGGMRQRVMIAMALACRPDILIADEPTTALDVTVQAQIFDLLRELQRDKGTAIMLITHDMGAVAEMADRVIVMYAGRVIEQGTTAQVLGAPRHPYTQGLIECLPELGSSRLGARPELTEIPGVVPSIWELGSGCAFRERCARAMPRCAVEVPPLFDAGGGHSAACWLMREEADAPAVASGVREAAQ